MLFRVILLCSMTVCCYLNSDEPQQSSKTNRVVQFENEHVRVWKSVMMPHQPLKMHRHDFTRIVVGLKGGTLTKIEETGEISPLQYETGKAYWFPADPPKVLHGDINESDEPIEVMIIEFKNLDKTPSK